jgi:hypothetical protein
VRLLHPRQKALVDNYACGVYGAQKRLTDQIAEYKNAAHDYVQDGVRLLELAKKAYFLFKRQSPSEKRKLLQFRVFELDLEGSNSHRNVSPTV